MPRVRDIGPVPAMAGEELDEVGEILTTEQRFARGWGRFLDELRAQNMAEFRTHEQTVADVLSRYSVTDLIEQSEDSLRRGDDLFYAADNPPEIITHGTDNLIDWWLIASGENEYECRRFKNFVWCSCKAFFFSRRMCKHLALTVGVYCQHCRLLRAKHGKYCLDCHLNAARFGAVGG